MPKVGDLRCHDGDVSPTPRERAQARRIARAIAETGFVLPGTLTERLTRC